MLDSYNFDADTIMIARCSGLKEIRAAVRITLSQRKFLFPQSKDALILVKPNLNNDMNALMGNSTDLRILSTVIEWVKEEGYENIVIADGSNVGVDRRNIDVCNRLRIDHLAQYYGVRILNLNQDAFREVEFSNYKVKIARTCLDADFLISLPKIKTHTEAVLSLALKNMIGCVRGQDKRKIHRNLAGNIVHLNETLLPDIQIVDGLIAMEGNGPGDGSPRRLDLLISGTNPYVVDLVCAKLVGVDWRKIRYLVVAKEKGHIADKDIKVVERQIAVLAHLEEPPPRGILARLSDQRSLYWLKVLMRPLTSIPSVQALAYSLNIVQDVYDIEDDEIKHVFKNEAVCDLCGQCAEYCPMGIEIEKIAETPPRSECIHCLYCFFVCPKGALELRGKTGFLGRYIEKYAEEIRRATGNTN